MQKILDEICSKLFVSWGENIELFSNGDVNNNSSSNNHNKLAYDFAIKNDQSDDISLEKDAFATANLSEFSKNHEFISFLNTTDYKKAKTCENVIILFTQTLTESAKKYYKLLRAKGIEVTVGRFDKGLLEEVSDVEFQEKIKDEKAPVKVLKRVNQ